MLKTAKKSFSNPVWMVAFAAFVLVGCDEDVSLEIGGSDSGSSEEEQEEVESQQDGDGQEDEGGSQDEDEGSSNQDGESSSDGMATLMWNAPLERENGDSLKIGAIDNYVVSWGQDPSEMGNSIEVNCQSCAEMEYVIEELGEGEWYFTVQTVDTDGNVSRQADAVSKNI